MTTATRSMGEAELLSNVLELASLFGWRSAHFRPAMTAHGWRTAVSGDGKGFPDLVLVRGDRLIAAKLKSEFGGLSDDQRIWLDVLGAVAEVHVWRPADWTSGSIESVLRRSA